VHAESEEITALDILGKRKDALLLLLHHESGSNRANQALDWDARGAGTFGIAMATESQIYINRYRDLPPEALERQLRFRGRHMPGTGLTLRYNSRTGLYEYVVDGAAATYYELLYAIRRNISGEEFTAKEFEEAAAVSRATAYRQLALMSQAGVLSKDHKAGTFRLSSNVAKSNI